MSDFQAIQARAIDIRQKYSQLNQGHGHQDWDGKAFAMGFVGDVGDLLKLIMAKENYRTLKDTPDIDAKLQHELSDCLWSIFAIAHYYKIDMETAFTETMDELDARIAGGQE